MGDSERWRWLWCRLWGDLDRWELLYLCLTGDRLAEYLSSFLTCFLEVLWASINLFKVSPELKIFLSIIWNLFSVKLLFSWGVHWARDTDVRQQLTLLTDALEILFNRGHRRRYNNRVSKLGFRRHCNVLLSTNQYLKTKLVYLC